MCLCLGIFFTGTAQTHPRIGLCLSGGGALGFAHIGALQALKENGIVPDEVSGSSMGAIVGCLYAAGYSPQEMLQMVKTQKLYQTYRLFSPYKHNNKSGYTTHETLKKFLMRYLPANSFDSLKIPLYVCVSNMMSRKYSILSTGGNLVQWVVASASIPVLCEIVNIEDSSYLDGGLYNNLPAQPLSKNCDIIIGVDVTPYEFDCIPANTPFNALLLSVRAVLDQNTRQGKKLCHHLIVPEAVKDYNEMSFKYYKEIYNYGYTATLEYLVKHPSLKQKTCRE
ncbi:MAG: patatin-like phospholipase family protein [Bacteroidales bacterium]|nr:patatin-like phospholipase family protein [Bacteroidales bacterium]